MPQNTTENRPNVVASRLSDTFAVNGPSAVYSPRHVDEVDGVEGVDKIRSQRRFGTSALYPSRSGAPLTVRMALMAK